MRHRCGGALILVVDGDVGVCAEQRIRRRVGLDLVLGDDAPSLGLSRGTGHM